MRDAILAGDIPAATAAIESAAPAVAGDGPTGERFALLRQHAAELVRQGAREQALTLVRTHLAPLALAASPDAYGEFRATLLLLVEPSPPATGAAPDHPAWRHSVRSDLAGRVARGVLRETGAAASPPPLLAALRYLLLVHDAEGVVAAFEGDREPGPDGSLSTPALAARLAGERGPPPPAPPSSSSGPFPEATVQALRFALALSREDAASALRAAGGDARAAVRDELAGRFGGEAELTALALDHAASRALPCAPAAIEAARARGWRGAAAAAAAHAAVRAVLAAADAGDTDAVEEALGGALHNEHAAAFDLGRRAFRAAASAGDAARALALARSRLAPLADACPALVPALKATVAGLMPVGGGASNDPPECAGALEALARTVLAAPPPRLLPLLSLLLDAHLAWFRSQHWEDGLEAAARLPELRAGPSPWARRAPPRADPPPPPPLRPSEDTASSMDDDEYDDEDDGRDDELFAAVELPPDAALRRLLGDAAAPAAPRPPPSEDAVVMVMEFGGVDRGRALALLAAHGSAQAAVASIFQD